MRCLHNTVGTKIFCRRQSICSSSLHICFQMLSGSLPTGERQIWQVWWCVLQHWAQIKPICEQMQTKEWWHRFTSLKTKHWQSGVFHVHGMKAERGHQKTQCPESLSPMSDIYPCTFKHSNKASLQPPKVLSSSQMQFKSKLKPPHSCARCSYPVPQHATLSRRTPVLTHRAQGCATPRG